MTEEEHLAQIDRFFDQRDVDDENAIRVTNVTQAENLLRAHFLNKVDGIIDYWDRLPQKSSRERISGAIFSVFNQFDGGAIDMPAFDITSRNDIAFPHNGTKVIIPKGTAICDGELHSQFVNRSRLLEEVRAYDPTQENADDNEA